jgi:plasmid stability protein
VGKIRNLDETTSARLKARAEATDSSMESVLRSIVSDALALPAVTKGFRDLADTLHDAQQWLNVHKAATNGFMRALSTDVTLVGNTIGAHRADFHAFGEDMVRLGKVVQLLAPAAVQAAGAVLTLGRVLADALTLNFGDINKLAADWREQNNAARINQLPTHDERAEAWRHYVQENGAGGVPANTLRAIGTVHQPALPPGFRTPQGQPGQKPVYFGPASGSTSAAPARDDHSVKVGTVSIVIQGAGKNAQEIADAVDARLQGVFGNPRSLQSSSSDSRTHRALPSILTKGIA